MSNNLVDEISNIVGNLDLNNIELPEGCKAHQACENNDVPLVCKLPVYKGGEIVGYTLIDKEDEPLVSKYKLMDSRGYVYTYNKSLHTLLIGKEDNKYIDHINRNKYDNRKCNLRFVSASVNSQNKEKIPGSSSKYKGVSIEKKSNKFRSTFCSINLGTYETEEHAAYAYNEYILENHPDDGYILNEIEKPIDYIKKEIKRVNKDLKGICKKEDKYKCVYYNIITKKHDYLGVYNTYEEAKLACDTKKEEIEKIIIDNLNIRRNENGIAILTVKNKREIRYSLVDDDIYEKCYKYTFNLDKDGYVRTTSQKIGRLNRFVFGEEAKGKKVKYVTDNKLDNRRSNLYLK